MAIYPTASTSIPKPPRTTSSPKTRWDPTETLGIINPDYHGITCIRYAPSQGRRCRNPIRAENRSHILRTLDEISYMRPDSPGVAARLRGIAGMALCVRWHQSQAGAVLRDWLERIMDLEVEVKVEVKVEVEEKTYTKWKEAKSGDRMKDMEEELRKMRAAFASTSKLLAELQENLNEDKGSERLEKERKAKNKEAERIKREEREREEKEQEERERKERERKERKREEREREEKRRRAAEAANERMRQNAQKTREKREREERENAQRERDTWDQLWIDYEARWETFKKCDSHEGNIGDAIPWPVKQEKKGKVDASAVKEFFKMAIPREANVSKLMRKESRKWHPDAVKSWLRDAKLTQADREKVDMTCRIVTDILNAASGRSSDFRE